MQVERSPQLAEPHIINLKAIELMAVNCEVAQTGALPFIVLVNANAHQVRHNIRQPVIVIAFHPHDFDIAFGVRKLADVAEKLPVLFGEAGKVEVGKNIAQQDQPLKTVFLQHPRGFARVAGFRTQVQVGKDQRVVDMQIHNLVLAIECYGVMKTASKLVQW